MAGVKGSQPQNLAPMQPNTFEAPEAQPMPQAKLQVPVMGEQVDLVPPPQEPMATTQASSADFADMEQFIQPDASGMDDMEQFVEDKDALAKFEDFAHSLPSKAAEFGKQAAEATYEAVPMIAGGVGGALGAAGGPYGAVAGGAAGYTFGTAAKQLLDQAFGVKPPKPVKQLVEELAAAPLEGATQEMGGQLIGKAVGKAYGAYKAIGQAEAAVPTAAGEKATRKAISRYGGVLSDQQKTGLLQSMINLFVPPPPVSTIATAGIPEQKLVANMANALEMNEKARRVGVNLLPHELYPTDPVLNEMHASAIGSKEFQDHSISRGDYVRQLVEQQSEAFQTGGKTAKQALATASTADKFVGQELQLMSEKAIDAAKSKGKDGWVDMTNLKNLLVTLRNDMGFTQPVAASEKPVFDSMGMQIGATKQAASIGAPSKKGLEAYAEANGLSSAEAIRLARRVQSYSRLLEKTNGKLPLKRARDLQLFFSKSANSTRAAFDNGQINGNSYLFNVRMKDAFRDDFVNGMGKFVEGEAVDAYNVARGRYYQLKTLPDSVERLLSKDSPATYDIVNWMNKGAEANIDNIAGLKKAVLMESPESWNAIAKEYNDNFFNQYAYSKSDKLGQKVGGFDWARMNKALREKGPLTERMELILGREKAEWIRNMAEAGEAIQQQATKEFTPSAGVAKYVRALGQGVRLHFNDAVDIISADHAARKLLGDPRAYKMLPKKDAELLSTAYHQAIGRAMSGARNAKNRAEEQQPRE